MRQGIEPQSSWSASQELNHYTATTPHMEVGEVLVAHANINRSFTITPEKLGQTWWKLNFICIRYLLIKSYTKFHVIIPITTNGGKLILTKGQELLQSDVNSKLEMSLWNIDAPGGNKVKIWQKSLSYIFTLPHPQGHEMSVKCEQPIDELSLLTVLSPELWILHFVSGMEWWTDRRSNY